MKRPPITLLLLAAAIVACRDTSTPDASLQINTRQAFGRTVADPTATVTLPIADIGLSVKSDGKYSDGTYSTYASGICGVNSTIFITGSGDMVLDAGMPNYADRKCINYPRKVSVTYPDGATEIISGPLLSVNEMESPTYRIAIGATVKRHFHVRTQSTRCDGVHWGSTVGGDSVLVNRVSASKWHVYTQPAPNNNAACKLSTGNTPLGPMPIDLWITSSRDLQ